MKDRRTAVDYALVLRDLADVHVPKAKRIVLVHLLDECGHSPARQGVHRFNDEGPEGLIDRPCGGSTSRLSTDQLADLVDSGPDPDIHGVVRWRRADLRDVIRTRFDVDYHERHVGRILHDLGLSHISARPQHPDQDPVVIEESKKTLARH